MNCAVLFQMLTTQLVQLSCLAVAIFGLTYWIGRERPHFTHALWALFLLKCLTPPIIASPTSVFSWASGCFQPKSQVLSLVDTDTAAEVSIEGLGAQARLPPVVVKLHPEEMVAGASGYVSKWPSLGEWWSRIQSLGWFEIAIATWIAVGGVILLLTGIRLVVFMRLVRRRQLRPCEASRQMSLRTQRLAKEVASRLRIRRGVKVKIVDALIGPAILGLVKPTILLPRIVVERSRQKDLEILLAHELVHFRRGDLWWSAIQSICTCLYWCNPLMWVVRSVVNREAEKCCDEETIGSLDCEPGEYARCLLSVLEWKHSLRSAPLLPGVRPVDITARRLERIMSLRHGCQTRCPSWVVASAFLGAVLVLPGGAFTRAQQPDSETQKDATAPSETKASPTHALKEFDESLSSGVSEKKQAYTLVAEVSASPASLTFVEGEKGYRVASIRIKDVLEKLSESVDVENVTLKDELLKRLSVAPVPAAVSAELMHSKTVDNPLQGKEATLSLGGGKPNVAVVDNVLHVLGTEASIEEVKEQLRHFRDFGFGCLVYRVKIIELPSSCLVDVGFDLDASGGLEDSVELKTKGVIRASHTETNWNSFCKSRNVTAEQVKLLLSADGCSQLSAPQITAINGQSAEISIGNERPFVTGQTRVKNEDGTDSSTFQPKVEVVQEGLQLKLLGTLVVQDDGLVQLDVVFTQSKVTNVDTFTFAGTDDVQQVTIQMPQIRKSHMSTTLNVELGKTVALTGPVETVERKTTSKVPYVGRLPFIGGLFKNVSVGRERMSKVVLITCELSDVLGESAVSAASPAAWRKLEAAQATPAVPAKVGQAKAEALPPLAPKLPQATSSKAAATDSSKAAATDSAAEGSERNRYARHSIPAPVPPVRQGKKLRKILPPTDLEILKCYDKANGTNLGKAADSVVKIVKQKIADYVDPPRTEPLLGQCQPHHMHYKCTIYYIDEEKKERVDLIYVDHNHFYSLDAEEPVDSDLKEMVKDDASVFTFGISVNR